VFEETNLVIEDLEKEEVVLCLIEAIRKRKNKK